MQITDRMRRLVEEAAKQLSSKRNQVPLGPEMPQFFVAVDRNSAPANATELTEVTIDGRRVYVYIASE